MNRPLRGPLNPNDVDHATDTYHTIDWLVKNVPETNGKVGILGTSYDVSLATSRFDYAAISVNARDRGGWPGIFLTATATLTICQMTAMKEWNGGIIPPGCR
jgi:hypothetical protein